ncbi:hypothetical protein EDD15DRAFT_2203834 [Pisolithus albus]|nr:hypothetical protein EDD15DRAFT_2203834 [Pisolithus albus]
MTGVGKASSLLGYGLDWRAQAGETSLWQSSSVAILECEDRTVLGESQGSGIEEFFSQLQLSTGPQDYLQAYQVYPYSILSSFPSPGGDTDRKATSSPWNLGDEGRGEEEGGERSVSQSGFAVPAVMVRPVLQGSVQTEPWFALGPVAHDVPPGV